MNTIIMPNVTIGKNCIIGCGAIITENIPGNSVAAGVSARIIKTIEEYYASHKKICDFPKNLSHEEKREYLKKNLI